MAVQRVYTDMLVCMFWLICRCLVFLHRANRIVCLLYCSCYCCSSLSHQLLMPHGLYYCVLVIWFDSTAIATQQSRTLNSITLRHLFNVLVSRPSTGVESIPRRCRRRRRRQPRNITMEKDAFAKQSTC